MRETSVHLGRLPSWFKAGFDQKGDKREQKLSRNDKKRRFPHLSQPPGIAPGRSTFSIKHTEKRRSYWAGGPDQQ